MTLARRPRTAALVLAITASLGVAALGPSPALAAKAAASSGEQLVPYEEFTLPNGLRVIVHTDRKAPIVAVNLWYHVGSKDEPAGRSGFAHLFEHLMFNGSENYRGEFFEPDIRTCFPYVGRRALQLVERDVLRDARDGRLRVHVHLLCTAPTPTHSALADAEELDGPF